MKHLFPIFALAAFLLASVPASAQISIDEVNAEQQSVTFQDKLKSTSVDVDYFNLVTRPSAPLSARSATTSNSAAGCRAP